MSADAPEIRDGAPDGDAVLAAEFALRLLPPAEEAQMAARVTRDPDFAALVERWRTDLGALDGGFAEVRPPRRVKARVEARLFGKPRSGPRRLWSSLALWRGLALVAGLVALWLGLATPRLGSEAPGLPEARLVSAILPVEGDLELLALFEPQAAVLSLNRLAGAPEPGRVHELWLIPEGEAPVSLGVLPETQRARVPLTSELAGRVAAGATLAISDEPPGGSPTGQPTGAVLAAGPITGL